MLVGVSAAVDADGIVVSEAIVVAGGAAVDNSTSIASTAVRIAPMISSK